MPPKKSPLAERNVNATPEKASRGKNASPSSTKKVAPNASQSLIDVANNITKTHGKKRAHEDEDSGETTTSATTKSATQSATQSSKKDENIWTADLSEDESEELIETKYNCNQIRSKMTALVNSGTIRVGQLQDKLRISSNAYSRFMKQSGPDKGSGSDVYAAALRYFINREGHKIPRGSKKPKLDNSSANSTTNAKGKGGDDDKLDVSDITLPDEEQGQVPVFDTCDDIRTKINAHLRKPGQNMAKFGRTISHTFAVSSGSNAADDHEEIPGREVKAFLGKTGPRGGATSRVYYAAYVYFEKLRVKQRKDKSKKRLEMEKAHGPSGADVKSDESGRLWLHASETAHEDKYGVLHIEKLPPGASATRPRRR